MAKKNMDDAAVRARLLNRIPGWMLGITIVSMFTFVASALAWGSASSAEDLISQGLANGYRTRALACLNLVVDDDRYFTLPDDCTDPMVTRHYPPEVCESEKICRET